MSRAEGRGNRSSARPARKSTAKAGKREAAGGLSQTLNIGHGNLVMASRIVAIVSPAASPMRRLREEAAERNKLVDATMGRRTRSILVTDSDHIILSAVNPDTIAQRLAPNEAEGSA